jgi:4-hydroxybenzoate polyprenyltransferase
MGKWRHFVRLARPGQYVKNGFVWLPVFFGYRLGDPAACLQTLYAFLSFCLTASAVYAINDLKDVEEDRRHPVKRRRPLASGALKNGEAVVFLLALLAGAGLLSIATLPPAFLAVLGAYLVLNVTYSFLLKHRPLIDVTAIAAGFVLRVVAGGVAAMVPVSHWIITMTFLLALFLALAKRRDDLLLATQGHRTRRAVDGYSLEFVSASMSVMAAVIIVAYLLYTVSPETIRKHGTDQLYLTGFWVILGLLRYLQIAFVEEQTGSPTAVFLKDRFLQAVIILWISSFLLLLYGSRWFPWLRPAGAA